MPHTNALLESNEIIPNIIASRQRRKSVDYLENKRSEVSLENKGYRSAIADVYLENKRSFLVIHIKQSKSSIDCHALQASLAMANSAINESLDSTR